MSSWRTFEELDEQEGNPANNQKGTSKWYMGKFMGRKPPSHLVGKEFFEYFFGFIKLWIV
jgi:hypothetical protein